MSDEIVSSLDWYATLATMIGESQRIPQDRPMDSIDQSEFILGKQKKSNREHVITYVGNEVYSVKWRSLKVHFITAQSTFSTIQRHTFPQVYDIKNDPDEKRELWEAEGFAHTWVMKPVMEILGAKARSMKQFSNIKPGEDFSGYQNTTATAPRKKASLEDAKTINLRLTVDGRIAIYGIQFDLNEAEVKPASEATMRSISEVLRATPKLKIAVVGHTDSLGSHEINMRLSKLRADAVVRVLRTKYKITASRMFAAGAGFLSPLATNDTEEGRALNRRVELIRMK